MRCPWTQVATHATSTSSCCCSSSSLSHLPSVLLASADPSDLVALDIHGGSRPVDLLLPSQDAAVGEGDRQAPPLGRVPTREARP